MARLLRSLFLLSGLSAARAFTTLPTLAPRSPLLPRHPSARLLPLSRLSRSYVSMQAEGGDRTRRGILGAAAFGAAAAMAGFTVGKNGLPNPAQATARYEREEQVIGSDRKLTPSEANTISLFRDNTPSVVFISTYQDRGGPFKLDVEQMEAGTGSGFVWDDKGHIVTNYHVIQSATAATIGLTTKDGTTTMYPAKLAGVDPDKDIAVLKIDTPQGSLRPVKIGRSSDLLVGQLALAIGNPFGLDHTLTTGVISGLGRETRTSTGRPLKNLIQTDAAINPGNSGGALLDSEGCLIGMNTAIFSPSGASAGIGFAIPVDAMKPIVNQLIQYGRTTRPALGISFLEAAQAKQLGLPKGVLVLEAPASSPAGQAGIRSTTRGFNGISLGDIIVGVEKTDVKDEADLFAALEEYKPNETVTIRVLRNGKGGLAEQEIKVKLGESDVRTPTLR
eukprot:CAMPEP_0206259922 /NCGR_PEP_ID=MMETSP0047_2-20121206/26782_1 /ASSEMBLY_ACC=CAM_ASM_000192 /TAXON_ID=195065 /ORGANISM="Chroomonas mesostigmatica_cf, Strain CCMP1168" /LENGTH=447 /DNA_ID=CAMNT_0053686907 /DNA_START=6 /DNA_END=1349 /DNA_ORIENTATION=+